MNCWKMLHIIIIFSFSKVRKKLFQNMLKTDGNMDLSLNLGKDIANEETNLKLFQVLERTGTFVLISVPQIFHVDGGVI